MEYEGDKTIISMFYKPRYSPTEQKTVKLTMCGYFSGSVTLMSVSLMFRY